MSVSEAVFLQTQLSCVLLARLRSGPIESEQHCAEERSRASVSSECDETEDKANR